MNWGLFLALVGFLLPLSLIVRLALEAAGAGRPIVCPGQLFRLVTLLLLMLPITGKASAVVYGVTGRDGAAGQLQIDFMATPWGWAHFGATLAAVLAFDLIAPTIDSALAAAPIAIARPAARYLLRDAGIVAICFGLGWAAAR